MTTLILNGSPRPDGDTAALIAALRETLSGEVLQLDCFREDISSCVDCRSCESHLRCALRDDMAKWYPVLERCDCIVAASPVYFSLPTPPLLAVASRLQPYFCASFLRKEPPVMRPKRGAILLTGGGNGSAEPAEAALRRILRAMRVKDILPTVRSLATDRIPAAQDADALAAAARCGRQLSAFAEEDSV